MYITYITLREKEVHIHVRVVRNCSANFTCKLRGCRIKTNAKLLKLTRAISVKCWLLIISQALTPKFNTRRRKLTSEDDWKIMQRM